MKLELIKYIIDEVIKDVPFIYDLSVTTPPPELVTQRAQDHYNRGKPESLNQSYQLDSSCKSIIVWNVFSRVAYDYHYKNNFLPEIISRLNTILYDHHFGYDDYLLNRKQFAIRSGAATLAKPSLAFHKRFGMNYKIDLIFTDAIFDETVVVEGEPHYSNCIGCDAPCESKCPMGCTMNFDLVDWEKCSNFVDVPEAFKDLDSICRICQDSCPYSQELTKRILEINPRYGERIHA
tara:strand:+ start:11221 stop:11925 length:705 start_codon:yes stop_codon:yes gene_type:complete